MDFFTNWWDSLNVIQQVFACMAVPATVLLILQTLLLMFGIGGHSADHGEFDTEHDFDHNLDNSFDHDHSAHIGEHDNSHDGAHHFAGVRIFTVRGIIALFAVGGWLGIAMIDLGASTALSIIVALLGGILALFLVAFVIKLSLSLQESGNINVKNAVSKTAKVYIPIPPSRSGSGKVMLNLQERFVEMNAMTDFDETIKTDSMVQVVSVLDDTLIVRPLVTAPMK